MQMWCKVILTSNIYDCIRYVGIIYLFVDIDLFIVDICDSDHRC